MSPRAMSEQAFYVLSALAGQPLHGYGILTATTDLSGGRMRLRVGTLYGILDRLAAAGTIELDHEEVVDSRLRRYYRLTADGRHALTREAARLAADARMASRQLAASPVPAGGSA